MKTTFLVVSLTKGRIMKMQRDITIDCPKCKRNSKRTELEKRQGARLDEGWQQDYFCPHCGKLVLCDTDGKGRYMAQNGAVSWVGDPIPEVLCEGPDPCNDPVFIEEGPPADF